MSDCVDPETGLEVFYWCGQMRYRCPIIWESGKRCDYDTYELEQMRHHMNGSHNATGEAPKRQIKRVSPLVDHEGKPIIHEDAPLPDELQNLKFK